MEKREEKYLLLRANTSEFVYNLPSNAPLILEGENPEIGLHSLMMWYTFPNIAPEYNNDHVRIYNGTEWKDITIPVGMYEVNALSKYLNGRALDQERGEEDREIFRLYVDKSTFHCHVKLAPGVQIDFTNGLLHELLGLDTKIYDQPIEAGPNLMNITRGLDRILIRCNLVNREHQPQLHDVLYDVLPFSSPGGAIQEKIENIEFVPCTDDVIRRVEIRLTDAHNRPVEIIEPISMKLVFRS